MNDVTSTTPLDRIPSTRSSESDEVALVTDVEGLPVECIWNFLETSGFIYPEKRQMIDFDAAKATLGKLIRCWNNVFKGLVVLRGDSIHAHISAIRIYDRVWMVQHMASRPYKRDKTSHALMLNLALLEHFEQSSNVDWVRATYRHENKRVSRLYESLAAQVTDPQLSITQYLNCMRLSGPVAEAPNPSNLEVEPLPDSDLPRCGLDMECFQGLSDDYERIGLERRQRSLGVFRAGIMVGYSCLETSSTGLNLSELTNAFRVSMLTKDPEVLAFLVRKSVDFYRVKGPCPVVALVDDSVVPNFESLGFDHFKRYTFWTWHQSLCRKFYDYIKGWQG
jgi:hypothetical protein